MPSSLQFTPTFGSEKDEALMDRFDTTFPIELECRVSPYLKLKIDVAE
jgi:hypothetical protein